MSLIRFMITITIVASCNASGIGHIVPAVRSYPIVRYAPFYNFPNGGVRSVHAIAPAPVFSAPAPVFPAPAVAPSPLFTPFAPRLAPVAAYAPAPLFGRPVASFAPIVRPVAHAVAPSPVFSGIAPAPVFPAPAFPASAFPAPAFPAPAFPAPAFPAPAFPAPTFPAPAFPVPLAPPAYPSAQAIALAKAFPYSIPPHAAHTHFYGPAPPEAPAPILRQAWK